MTDVLPNGIRVVCEPVAHAHSIALGIWIDAGARDESEQNAGISHFVEHLLFKGTERRSARDIAEEFDAIGGQLNAVTDKEYTCYYVKVLPEHLDLALDVLADMIQHPLLDPEEFEREKHVILEEIKEHEDTPEDLVHDVFAGTLWPRHPLGRPVIGRQAVIEALTPADLERTVYIRGQSMLVIEALNRSVTHTAYHVGQIVYVVRHLVWPDWTPLTIPKGKSGEPGTWAKR